MEKHVKLVGILYIVLSILGLVGAIALYGVLRLIGNLSDDADANMVLNIVANVVAVVLLVCSIPGILGGWGLLKHKEWARILIIILSILNLLNFPLGTALGIYSIWTLVQAETSALFSKQAPIQN